MIGYSQTNNIKISAILNTENNELKIQQEIDFFNNSNKTLNEVYFHNWPNSFKDKYTPLAKRFVENYSKTFHFAKEEERGSTYISSISANYEISTWEITDKNPDILKVSLNQPLNPKDSVKIIATYSVKIPKDKFTKYGVNNTTYNLRYWYLIPAVIDTKWHLMNNLDMDDLYVDFTNYTIDISIPNDFILASDLDTQVLPFKNFNKYTLTGKNKFDIELHICKQNDFIEFNPIPFKIITNLDSDKLEIGVKTDILTRELLFIESYLGEFPSEKLLINKIEYDKNPVYGFNQLPSFLAPFNDAFEWDIKMFKILTKKYIDNLFLYNQREDSWLTSGLQTYLMIKYVETYYPEKKAIGELSKIWGVRSFNLAKIDFNGKYPYVYQFAARKNLDQALTTPLDSLSNFNRKIVNKYKAGIGLRFLENYLEKDVLKKAIVNFSKNSSGKKIYSNYFFDYLETSKDLTWFRKDFVKTNKRVDYTIKKIVKKKDSVDVTILNKRNMTTPIQLYGINKKEEIIFKKWLTNIDSSKTITVPKKGVDRLSLNYELDLPEYNLRNNWKNVDKFLFNRPLQFKFFKDIENPYYNQLFYTPVFRYNYYDGVVLGVSLSNQPIIKKNYNYKISPSYSTKSRSLSGSYSFAYEYLPENKKVNLISAGIAGSNYHYDEDLTYSMITPFALIEFKRKSLRDIESKAISASYTMVNKEKSPTQKEHPESNKYKVFNLNFGYTKPDIIEDIHFSTGLQIADKFSKVSLTGRYRILTDKNNRQFDFRFFAGAFINNNTKSNYFSFALDRPTDYLFQYDYIGRSETTGFFSQQVIINEGGFKSKLPVAYANQWMSTINTNIGLWRWLEIYNDVGFVKNRNEKVYFAHDNGIRLNFIQDILEVYFPLYSNNGWEISEPSYASRIRFVLVIKPKKIYNFVKRGFY